MITYDLQKNENFWRGLLTRREARVLSSIEERKLLVELAETKERILEGLCRSDGAKRDASARLTPFHQLIRDLADPEVTRFDPLFGAVRPLARHYQEIRAELAMANVRLVAHVAKRYLDRGIPPADLLQEGFCALLVAIDRFDIANETRLATYAIWWIRQAIQRAVAGGAYPVRLNPRQLHQLAREQEIATARDRDRPTRADPPSSGFSPSIERVFAATRPVISLDAPSRNDDTVTLGEFFIPPDEETSEADDAQTSVGDLIRTLTAREQLVLKLRFGLGGEEPMTLIQVSRILGVSKERVRQIQDRAVKRLRASRVGAELRRRSRHVPPPRSLSQRRG
jgi:RNA polymerase primary sigma factor